MDLMEQFDEAVAGFAEPENSLISYVAEFTNHQVYKKEKAAGIPTMGHGNALFDKTKWVTEAQTFLNQSSFDLDELIKRNKALSALRGQDPSYVDDFFKIITSQRSNYSLNFSKEDWLEIDQSIRDIKGITQKYKYSDELIAYVSDRHLVLT